MAVYSATRCRLGRSIMHQGRAYHDFMLASPRDVKVRDRFQRLVYQFTPYKGTILDFGAGTGIDAKAYAESGFRVLVHEPSVENRAYLAEYCRDELKNGEVAATDLMGDEIVHMIVANFAVLNLVADHKALFAKFGRLLAPNGYVVINMLNPFFAGDARYTWWRKNLGSLLRNGGYVIRGDAGPIYRFSPAAVARSAQPGFHLETVYPNWPRLAVTQYMFIVFRKMI
jgi:SAM-dependent methyltransferase